MTLKDEIIEMLRKSKNGLTIESITRKSSVTKHHSRVGNVLSALQKAGNAHMDGEGKWHMGEHPNRAEIADAIQFMERLAKNFGGLAKDALRVRDLLKKGVA
jgi:DNA-binding IclR family transcriptional regulator